MITRHDAATMKVERRADHAVSEASCREATGKTLAEWFKTLDELGGSLTGSTGPASSTP